MPTYSSSVTPPSRKNATVTKIAASAISARTGASHHASRSRPRLRLAAGVSAAGAVRSRGGHSRMATASISMRTPLGRAATATVERAGYGFSKNPAYTSLTSAKSFMSVRKMVVLTIA